jgi:hypothetical protein
LKNRYLNFALPFALIPAISIFGDEIVSESPPSVQQEDHHYRRVSAGFDMFWLQFSYKNTGQDSNMKSYHYHGKSRDSFEGLRFTSELLKPNSFYTGINFLVAVGDNHSKEYVNHKKVSDNSMSTNSWVNLDTAFGYNFQPSFSPRTLFSVFVGPGFHWERAFHHNARWGYAMTGFKLSQGLTESLSFGVDFKTMYSFGTKDPHEVTRGERKWVKHFWGFEMGTPVTWHIGEMRKFDLQFKPYMLKWNMNSMATALGFTAALGYSF